MEEKIKADYLADLDYFHTLLDRAPNSTLYLPVAFIYSKLEKHDEVIETAKAGLVKYPSFTQLKVIYANSLVQLGRKDEALELLLDVIMKDDDNYMAFKLLALIYKSYDDKIEAAKYIRAAFLKAPEDPELAEWMEEFGGFHMETASEQDAVAVPAVIESDSAYDFGVDQKLQDADVAMSDVMKDLVGTRSGPAVGIPEKFAETDGLGELLAENAINESLSGEELTDEEIMKALFGEEDEEEQGLVDALTEEEKKEDAVKAITEADLLSSVPSHDVSSGQNPESAEEAGLLASILADAEDLSDTSSAEEGELLTDNELMKAVLQHSDISNIDIDMNEPKAVTVSEEDSELVTDDEIMKALLEHAARASEEQPVSDAVAEAIKEGMGSAKQFDFFEKVSDIKEDDDDDLLDDILEVSLLDDDDFADIQGEYVEVVGEPAEEIAEEVVEDLKELEMEKLEVNEDSEEKFIPEIDMESIFSAEENQAGDLSELAEEEVEDAEVEELVDAFEDLDDEVSIEFALEHFKSVDTEKVDSSEILGIDTIKDAEAKELISAFGSLFTEQEDIETESDTKEEREDVTEAVFEDVVEDAESLDLPETEKVDMGEAEEKRVAEEEVSEKEMADSTFIAQDISYEDDLEDVQDAEDEEFKKMAAAAVASIFGNAQKVMEPESQENLSEDEAPLETAAGETIEAKIDLEEATEGQEEMKPTEHIDFNEEDGGEAAMPILLKCDVTDEDINDAALGIKSEEREKISSAVNEILADAFKIEKKMDELDEEMSNIDLNDPSLFKEDRKTAFVPDTLVDEIYEKSGVTADELVEGERVTPESVKKDT